MRSEGTAELQTPKEKPALQQPQWQVIDSFRYDFCPESEMGGLCAYRLKSVAIRAREGAWDTLEIAVLAGPGLLSDSSLLLVALSLRLPPKAGWAPEKISYYEYLLSSQSLRPARLPLGFHTGSISPDGRFAAYIRRDTTVPGLFGTGEFYAEVQELPQFRVVGTSESITCLETDSPFLFEWTGDGNLHWERAFCSGLISLPRPNQRSRRQ